MKPRLRAASLVEGGIIWFLFFLPLNEVVMELGLLVSLGAYGWQLSQRTVAWPPLNLASYLFLALGLSSVTVAFFSPIASTSILFAVILLLSVLVVFLFFQAQEPVSIKLSRYAHALLLGVSVLSLYHLGRHFSLYGLDFSEHRLGYDAYVSLFTAVALPWVFSLALNSSAKQRYLYGFWFLFLLACLILSFGRGAWVGAVCGLFLVSLGLSRKVMLVFCLCLLLGVSAIYPFIKSRARDLIRPESRSNAQRIIGWQTALKMTRSYPLTGVGFANFKERYWSSEFRPVQAKAKLSHAHNIFLQLYAEQGIIVGSLFFLLALVFILKAIEASVLAAKKNTVYSGGGAALLSLLILGQFACSMLIVPRIWFLFCFLGALLTQERGDC